jgi:hypothetical protein
LDGSEDTDPLSDIADEEVLPLRRVQPGPYYLESGPVDLHIFKRKAIFKNLNCVYELPLPI